MNAALFEFKAWLVQQWKAAGPHQVHSPHIFRLLTQVLKNQSGNTIFQELNTMRSRLRKDRTELEIEDFGAGPRKNKQGKKRSVQEIAKNSLQSRRCAEHLFRIVSDLQPRMALELGTSLGITTAYMARASESCQWITMEGSTQIADFARKLLTQLDVKNVKVQTGNFDDILPIFCANHTGVDFVLFDGNHKLEPTLRYFNILAKLAHEKTVFIFDDIHWSKEMEEAWSEIQKSPSVSLTVDFFHFGMVLFRGGIEKQHFILRLP